MDELGTRLEQAVVGRYQIDRELGRGGMAVVFLAVDLRHRRRVALKVLKPELIPALGAERFLREIEIAARLTHPNVLPLHESGEADGLLYYVMPYIEGETLRDRLNGARRLPIDQAVQVALQVAEALGYAHSLGVVHRDIKPENILFQAGQAIVSDFGIARAVSESTGSLGATLTETGMAVGTLAYMSPEQAAGLKDIDGRSDLYSLGCVLYEMLTGETPLGRGPDLRSARGSVSLPLAEVVAKALARNPADRFATAAAFSEALTRAARQEAEGRGAVTALLEAAPRSRWITRLAIAGGAAAGLLVAGLWWRARAGAAPAQEIRAIAVLPLENTSGDTTLAYLENAVTDHVRDALNTAPGLTVKARSSSLQLRGRSPGAVGAALGVGAVVQGTVSRSAEGLHVTTELVRAADDAELWSRTFDGPVSALAGMQDTIAGEVARTLHLDLSGRAGGAGASGLRGTTDAVAYESFLRGRSAYDRLEFPQAAIFFRAAVARDPRFARAEGYLAMSYANLPTLDVGPLDSVLSLARVTAAHALAMDSTVVEAYIAQAFVRLSEFRFGDALTPLARAMAIDSNDAILLTSYGSALAQAGRLNEGLVQTRRAYQRDPLSVPVIGILAYLLGLAGQSREAIAMSHLALQLDPTNALVYRGLGFQFAFAGLPDSAVAAFEAGAKLDSTSFGGRSSVLFGYAVAGRWSDVARQRGLIDRDPASPRNYDQAVGHLVDGDLPAAMTSLERAVAAREQYLGVISVACDPLFDPLKSNRRFETLMQRVGARACPPTLRWPVGPRPAPRVN